MVHWFWASGPNNSVPFFAVFVRPVLDKGLSTRPHVGKCPLAHVLKKTISPTTNCVDTWQGKKSSEFLIAVLEARLEPYRFPSKKGTMKVRNSIPSLWAAFRFIQSLPYTHTYIHAHIHTCIHTYTHKYIHKYKHAYKQITWWWCTA